MKPTDMGFYAILKTATGFPDASTDELIEPGIKGLGTANSRASVLDASLTKEERKRGARYYTTTAPVARKKVD
jgi:hypothetical protein